MMKLVGGLLLCMSTLAHAEPGKPVDLGGGLVLELSGKQLVARDGKRFVPLHEATEITEVSIDKARHTVAITTAVPESVRCSMTDLENFGFDELRAKIENRYAYLLHVKKDYKAAADGYAKAVALDPKWNIPAYNLASVRTELKDLDGAIQALAPWLKSAPYATFVQVSLDKELQPLLARPELVAIQAKKPGTAPGKFLGAAYSAELGLVAVPQSTGPFAQCDSDERIELYEVASGKEVARLPTRGVFACEELGPGAPSSSNRSKPGPADKRDPVNAAILDKLGFATVAIETSSEPQPGDEKWTLQFSKAKLGVVLKANNLNVLAGNKSFGTGTGMSKLGPSALLVEPRIAIVHTFEQGMEMCGEDPHRSITVVKLK